MAEVKELTLSQEIALRPIWMAESIDRGMGDSHQMATITVSVSGDNVTAVTPESADVQEGGSATFTLTFDTGKDADDITVTATVGTATVSGTTLTVSGVTADTTVTIADKA
jgi:hypothetical protein